MDMLRIRTTFLRNQQILQRLQRLHLAILALLIQPESAPLLSIGIEIRIIERRMSANLEIHRLIIVIANLPHHLYLIAVQLVTDSQCKCVRVFCQCLGIRLELVPQCVLVRRNQMEIHVPGKSMLAKCIFFSVDSIFLFPQTADDREQNRCVPFPECRVRLPDEFSAGMVSDATEFGSVSVNLNRQNVVLQCLHIGFICGLYVCQADFSARIYKCNKFFSLLYRFVRKT